MNFRMAKKEDAKSIESMLIAAKLPHDDCRDHLDNFFVFVHDNQVISTGGLELFDKIALLRSVAVREDHRHKGLGKQMFLRVRRHASEQNVDTLYLLTETAESYFKKLGFITINRSQAPPAIRQTKQFSSLCPASAVVMEASI